MTAKNKLLLSSLLAGGVTFWLAESFFSLFGEMLTVKSWMTIQTISLPFILIVLLLVIVKKYKPEGAILNAFSMVFGIWFLSPFYILVLSIFTGHGITALKVLGWQLLAFPATAITTSMFTGGFLALLATSIALPVA